MEYRTLVAPKKQFIFDVMIPPLNRVSPVHVTEQALMHQLKERMIRQDEVLDIFA